MRLKAGFVLILAAAFGAGTGWSAPPFAEFEKVPRKDPAYRWLQKLFDSQLPFDLPKEHSNGKVELTRYHFALDTVSAIDTLQFLLERIRSRGSEWSGQPAEEALASLGAPTLTPEKVLEVCEVLEALIGKFEAEIRRLPNTDPKARRKVIREFRDEATAFLRTLVFKKENLASEGASGLFKGSSASLFSVPSVLDSEVLVRIPLAEGRHFIHKHSESSLFAPLPYGGAQVEVEVECWESVLGEEKPTIFRARLNVPVSQKLTLLGKYARFLSHDRDGRPLSSLFDQSLLSIEARYRINRWLVRAQYQRFGGQLFLPELWGFKEGQLWGPTEGVSAAVQFQPRRRLYVLAGMELYRSLDDPTRSLRRYFTQFDYYLTKKTGLLLQLNRGVGEGTDGFITGGTAFGVRHRFSPHRELRLLYRIQEYAPDDLSKPISRRSLLGFEGELRF